MREIAEPFERGNNVWCLVAEADATAAYRLDGERWLVYTYLYASGDFDLLDPALLPKVGKALPPVPRKVKVFTATGSAGELLEFRAGERNVEWREPARFPDWRQVQDETWHYRHITPSMHRAIADALEDGGCPMTAHDQRVRLAAAKEGA